MGHYALYKPHAQTHGHRSDSVLVNELRGLKRKHRGFQQSSIKVSRDAVKRQFITSGGLGLSWHPCQVCGKRSVFVCESQCGSVWVWGEPGGCMPRQCFSLCFALVQSIMSLLCMVLVSGHRTWRGVCLFLG